MKKFLLYLFFLVPLIVPVNADALSIADSEIEFFFSGYGIDIDSAGEWIDMGVSVSDDLGSDGQWFTGGDWSSLPPSISVLRDVSGIAFAQASGGGFAIDLVGDLIVTGYAESDQNGNDYAGGHFWIEYWFDTATGGELFIDGWYIALQEILTDVPAEDADVNAFVSLTLVNDTTGEWSYDEFLLLNCCTSGSWMETGMLNVSAWFNPGDTGYLNVELYAEANAYSPIPEPSTLFMFASGIAGVIGLRKKLKIG
jgi:hypothetical protein